MLDAALSAIDNLSGCPCFLGFLPGRLVFLFFGVIVGLALGALPGLGGIVGLAILLPFTFDMDAYAALAMLVGLIAVTTTSDTIPSVLFSVPGSAGSQATILDGHPLAKQGQAGRAFGAAYGASLIGGLFGAGLLALSIPVLRPVILAFGAPEFFMLGILGISMVAVLSGGAPIRGLIAGAIGLGLGMIGMDPQSGRLRWVLGELYLWDGIPLVPVTLGIFAIPEIIDLTIKGTRIADVPAQSMKGVVGGIRDVFRHWFLVIRCSALGVWVGAIPGLGASVVDWFAYGHALQTEKGARESFGKGDIRGVIAPESANNAKEGGGLIPTIAFGVPGSASMAILLGAFLIHGLTPGPDMLTEHLDVTYTMIWSLALANVLGAGICLAFTPQLAKITMIRIHFLAPLVIVIVFLAAFQSSASLGDLVSLLGFSVFGWSMKRFGWPRPPLILGLVLSGIIERYLFISVQRYDMAWLSRPMVLAIALLTVISLVYSVRPASGGASRPSPKARGPLRIRLAPGAFYTLLILAGFVTAVVAAKDWPNTARFFPWVIGIPGIAFCLIQLFIDLTKASREDSSSELSGVLDLPVETGVPMVVVMRRAATAFAWVFGFFAAIWLVGFLLTVPLFVWLYLTVQSREKSWLSVTTAALVTLFLVGVFHYVLHVHWLEGYIAWPQEAIIEWLGG